MVVVPKPGGLCRAEKSAFHSIRRDDKQILREACSELAEGLRMTTQFIFEQAPGSGFPSSTIILDVNPVS
jgi:hypothetical protein